MSINRTYVIAWIIAALLASSAFAYKFYINLPTQEYKTIPIVGSPGSTHAHASLLIMDRDNAISFCEQKYMLASQAVHFEEDDCIVVHKHATGVTLTEFFKSIEVTLDDECLAISDGRKLCSDSKNTLRVILNGGEVPLSMLPYYELQNNDHILVNYGPEQGALLRFKYNQVPNIPLDINEAESGK